MPLIFANEYNKYQNKFETIGKGFGNVFASFQEVIKPSISSVVEIGKNIKKVKDNVEELNQGKTRSDMDTFNNFNKVNFVKKESKTKKVSDDFKTDIQIFKK